MTIKPARVVITATILGFATSLFGQIISTVPAWDGVTAASPLGEPSVATIGQVFTVDPNFTHLDSIAFGIANTGTTDVHFTVLITAWDSAASHATGSVLFSTGPLTLPSALSTFVPLGLPANISLTGNTQYVAFFTASSLFDGTADSAKLAFVGSDVYAGGGTVFLDNGNDPALLGSATWGTTTADLAFTATFSAEAVPVPEPSTYSLVGGGLLMALIALRRSGKFRKQ